MRVLVDASLPPEVSDLLTTFGYDVADARHAGLAAAGEDQTFAAAKAAERTLLTARWEGDEPPNLLGGRSFGVIVFRYPADMPADDLASNVLEFLQAFCQEDWSERSALVALDRVQIHPPIPRSDYVDEPTMLG